MWANPHYNNENPLEKYAAHVRRRLWRDLDSLEGKLLGCWCENEHECHGRVLVELLEEKKMKEINQNFLTCGLRVDSSDLAEIRRAREWHTDPIFLAYATRLDRTNIFYFQPAVYKTIEQIWRVSGPPYWEAFTNDDDVYWVVGLLDGPQPIGPFWNDAAEVSFLEEGRESLLAYQPSMPKVYNVFLFAKNVQTYIDTYGVLFSEALKEALHYHALHRCIVRRVGHLNEVDMDDHDLTKSRIVHVALAYAHHWRDIPHDQRLLSLAMKAIVGGHSECEDHHPEFEEAEMGPVDALKLVVDRLSVHLQKDPVDKERGWQVDLKWIPDRYLNVWNTFKRANKHKDLYQECLLKAKKDLNSKPVRGACFYSPTFREGKCLPFRGGWSSHSK